MRRKVDLSTSSLFPWVICSKCNKPYPEHSNNFPYKNGKRHGRVCKECISKRVKLWAEENKDVLLKKKQKYRKRNAEKIHLYQREYNKVHQRELNAWRYNNPDKLKIVAVRSREKTKDRRLVYCRKRMGEQSNFETYASQLTIEEKPIEGGNGKLLVKCAYCGKYFYPTIREISARIASLVGRAQGENRMYCSNGCKLACPIYNQKKWPKGYKKASSREVDPLVRQMCLERDNYECQKCGKVIEEIELHAHHIEGAVQQPMIANDVDNTITLCKPCHKWVHRQKDCTYYDLRCKK